MRLRETSSQPVPISRTDKVIGIALATIVSVIVAVAACYGMFRLLIQLPQNSLSWWALETYPGLAIMFGSVFLLTSCGLVALYIRALQRVR